jgi:hypothetical protein
MDHFIRYGAPFPMDACIREVFQMARLTRQGVAGARMTETKPAGRIHFSNAART